MGLALDKFASRKKKDDGFDVKEAGKQSLLNILGPIGGVARGSESGHKTAGFLFGPSGAAGAEAKNTGKSKLYESMAGTAGTGALLVGLPAAAMHGVRGGLIGGALGASVGAPYGAIGYGAGHLFGKKYDKKHKD